MESEMTARDNGYNFFIFLNNKHPEINSYYVINKTCNDYEKVKKYKNVINYGTFKHWLYYMSAYRNISNNKNANPNNLVFYIVHIFLNLYNNRVFLQHGITKDNSPWLYYKNTKFKYFICGAKREYQSGLCVNCRY